MTEQNDQTGQEIGPMELRSVGRVHNESGRPILEVEQGGLVLTRSLQEAAVEIDRTSQVSKVVIDPGLEELLAGIEGYSHLVLLYWAHKVPDSGRCLTSVHPMGRADIPKQGLFSTCSPARPNPVLMCVVNLLHRRGNVLEVTGCDAVDGSPVIDIKPYIADTPSQGDVVVPEWMEQLQDEVEALRRECGDK